MDVKQAHAWDTKRQHGWGGESETGGGQVREGSGWRRVVEGLVCPRFYPAEKGTTGGVLSDGVKWSDSGRFHLGGL